MDFREKPFLVAACSVQLQEGPLSRYHSDDDDDDDGETVKLRQR